MSTVKQRLARGNIRSYGRGMRITPLAIPDDGLLDVCWVDPVKTLRLYRFFPTVFAGKRIDLPKIHYYRTTTKVEFSVLMDFCADGEFFARPRPSSMSFSGFARSRSMNIRVQRV